MTTLPASINGMSTSQLPTAPLSFPRRRFLHGLGIATLMPGVLLACGGSTMQSAVVDGAILALPAAIAAATAGLPASAAAGTAFAVGIGASLLAEYAHEYLADPERPTRLEREAAETMRRFSFVQASGPLYAANKRSVWTAIPAPQDGSCCLAIVGRGVHWMFESAVVYELGACSRSRAEEGQSTDEIAHELLPHDDNGNLNIALNRDNNYAAQYETNAGVVELALSDTNASGVKLTTV